MNRIKKILASFKENAVAYAAVFISLLALFVSVYQTRILSQEKHASVWPYLQIGHAWEGDGYSLSVENSGVGPAIIQNVEFHYNDTIFTRIHHFLSYVINSEQLKEFNGVYSNIETTGHVIPQGENENIIEIAKDSLAAEAVLRHRDSLYVIIDYCSIYGNCWRVEDYDTQKTKLKSEFRNLIY